MWLILFVSIGPFVLFAQESTLEAKVQELLAKIETSGCQFERNGSLHPGKEARSHLASKYENAKNSWFAPSKKDWTVELFIEKIASKSTISGDPYYVLCDGKPKITAKEWFSLQNKK